MMKLTLENIRQLYRMDDIIRYNTHQKHKKETVAAHSYYVALFTMMLCNELHVTKMVREKAMAIAIVHDIPEVVINDVTYEAKKHMPEVKDALEAYEKKILQANFPDVYESMFESYFVDDKIANAIVKLADTISVLQFSDYEEQMGNGYVKGWVDDTRKRIEKLKDELERLGISCQKIIL